MYATDNRIIEKVFCKEVIKHTVGTLLNDEIPKMTKLD